MNPPSKSLAASIVTGVALAVAVVCCVAGPAIVAIVVSGGLAAWLFAHGFALGGAALATLGALTLAWLAWLAWRRRHSPARCAVVPERPSDTASGRS